MLHPDESCLRWGTQANKELIAIATRAMIIVALDFLELGTIRAMNIAYKAMPIEFCILAGRTEQIVAPIAVPKAHPQ
ncbi:MAG: hypothetical protein GX795_11330 [Firmicutes bacterium]|nr:hypothetical protein [Bacillota bacterium]